MVTSDDGQEVQLDKQEELKEQKTSVSQIGSSELPSLQDNVWCVKYNSQNSESINEVVCVCVCECATKISERQ